MKNELFGAVVWATEDLENALETEGYPVTEENVADLFNAVNSHHFTDYIISAGWDFIYQALASLHLEEGE